MKTIRLGLLGTGFINEAYHMPALGEIENAKVVAIFGRSEARTSDFAKRWGIPKIYHGRGGLEAICKDPEIDIVDVGLPNSLHLDAATTAAENHKAVICEKPLGRTALEAREMVEAAQRYGVTSCYAENQVFMPKAVYAKKLIRQGTIGKITSVRAREAHSGPHAKWFKQKSISGGGVLLDMGCHTIELARFLIEEKPKEICGWTETFSRGVEVEDNCVVLVRYANGSMGQSENSWTAKGGLDVRFEVFGTDGSIFIDLTRETGIRLFTKLKTSVVEKSDETSGWLFPSIREHETYGFVDEMKHFVSCVANGGKPSEAFEDGYVVNRLVDGAYESARSRKWVKVNF